jgi:hypothetical protein
MPYPVVGDHRMPYDIDGTLVYHGSPATGATTQVSGANLVELNNEDQVLAFSGPGSDVRAFWFFPEQREVTGLTARVSGGTGSTFVSFSGSNDTANGTDGTWEAASLTAPSGSNVFDTWRALIRAVSFAGPKKNVRITYTGPSGTLSWFYVHLYGEAAAGQMAHDLVFVDPDLSGPFESVEDFGDQPLGTTVVRPFRVTNTSASRTATNVNIQCNHADFTIATSDSGPWVATINIASLAAGAESATMYTKCTTPAPGASLIPVAARIILAAEDGSGGNFFG